MDIIVFFKIKDSRRIYEKSERCMPPPPRETSKILISSALAVLLGVSAEASNGSGVSVDSNNVVFSDTNSNTSTQNINNTFTPSGSVYEANGANNTITFNSGVQTTRIDGGIKAGSGTKITLDFQGAGAGQGQTLNFGSSTSVDSRTIQTTSGGEIVFDFAGGTFEERKSFLIYPPASGLSISNDGTMTFNVRNYSRLSFGFNGSEGYITNQSGSLTFNFGAGSEVEGSGDYNKIVTKSGATTNINFLKNSVQSFSTITGTSLRSESGGRTTINLNESYAILDVGSLISDADNKEGMSVKMRGKSSVVFGTDVLQNVSLVFQSEDNWAYFGGFSNNITWIDNPQSHSNIVTLSAYTEFLYGGDYCVYRDDFNILEIGNKGDKTGKTGVSGENLTFVVYANLEAKAHLYAKDELGRDDYPLYDNNLPLIDDTKTPTIGGQELQGTYAYSDRVIIHSSQGNKGGVHNLGVVFSYWDYANLSSISYNGGDIKTEGNIAVASVSNDSKVTLNPTEIVVGFNSILPSFEKISTTEQGIIDSDSNNNTYTTYFLSSARDMGVAPVTQEVTSSVFALNYDLFLANFNSLNKRMGDLRDNPYSQGAWGRIFNGQLSNDFGLGSQNNYTTLQAGYDYDFGLENARNYLGVAFSYGFSISEMSSNAKDALQSREIKDIFSNSIELALYNAYISDNGFYSDSIAKFSYLMSDFNLTNNATTESLSVNNYALSLSEEVGYVFTLGESKEWSITPQAELGLGYYSSSDLTQVAGEFYLDAKADSLLMLRARVGSMVGYDFKQFTQGKDIQASLYAGLSYEFDYLNGGDIELTPNVGEKTLTKSALSSDGRGVLNIGTNLAIKDNTRLYVDFQTSFGGKINTDYQINIGARFSFGEKQEKKMTTLELPLKPTEG